MLGANLGSVHGGQASFPEQNFQLLIFNMDSPNGVLFFASCLKNTFSKQH